MQTQVKVTTPSGASVNFTPTAMYPLPAVDVAVRDQTMCADDLREMAVFLIDEANALDGIITLPDGTLSDTDETAAPRVPRVAMSPQDHKVLKHLRTKRSITRVEAEAVYRIRHLPGCIFRIRAAGHDVTSRWRSDPTGQRYVEYVLAR